MRQSVAQAARSFGKMRWTITTTDCVYTLPSIASGGAAAAGSAAISDAALAAIRAAAGACYYNP